MSITGPVVLLVLTGALLHAGWNVLVKSSADKAMDTALIHVLCSILALPVLFVVGLPPAHVWPYILASLIIHVGYYMALAGALKHGELGLAYPLMRGTAPLLVALGSYFLLDEAIAAWGWLGIMLISSGVLMLGVSAGLLHHRKAVLFALSNAVLIALYTVVDAQGARESGQVAQYIALLFALDGWPFALLVFLRRKGQVWTYVRARWPLATVGAAASVGSYAIALWAMTVAPMALVASLRETSVLFAVALGAWLLKEPWTRWRILGAVSIVAGVIVLRLG
ncbi:MAG: phosphonate utilization protein [Betaproteobacteria bacterium]|jgi:phosphonate utilization associated putative membrane protein|nr:phosphonate utilization protein [Betaproteobacteria bacterium]